MTNPLISECIRRFLDENTYPDLAALYDAGKEVQVLVRKGEGEKVESDFKGRKGDSFTDGLETWGPLRIPRKANSEPESNDRPMPFNLEKHVLAIGLTGWDYINKRSCWLGYDFDSIIGHSERHQKKLTDQELKNIREKLEQLPYVTLRRSTSGSGLHLYVFVDVDGINNHTEHAALARYVLGRISAETGEEFSQKVDAFGTVLWVYHRKIEENPSARGLELLKKGDILTDITLGWREQIPVIKGIRKKAIPSFINAEILNDPDTEVTDSETEFLELTGQRVKTPFDKEHQKLVKWLIDNGHYCTYNQDFHLLVTHTSSLKRAHEELQLKGIFDTLAQGSEPGDHNCYLWPLKHGAWVAKRYNPGVAESPNWFIDASGYTSCYFNREPDLRTAAMTYGGIESEKGGYVFNAANEAQQAAVMLGGDLRLPTYASQKKTILKKHTDGRLVAHVEYEPDTDSRMGGMPGWLVDGKYWKKIFSTRLEEPSETEVANFDSTIRHLLSPQNKDAGWAINCNGKEWQIEPIGHVKPVLKSLGYIPKDVEIILGSCIRKAWRLVNMPFNPEYPGDRQWNKGAAQLKYAPLDNAENLHYPTWLKMLTHVGKSLDQPLKSNKWAVENNILTGADYLKLWIASLFQYPSEPLPYLFFYGDEFTGKSSFHEAIELLMINGAQGADNALLSQGNFNAELESAILCIVEEVNVKANKQAHNRIKDWVKSPKITIHKKGIDPYDMPNYTHWIQCANPHEWCPIFPGDTIITVLYVANLPEEERIERKEFKRLLEKEAQDFITEVMNIEIPPTTDRLNIPVIISEEKMQIQSANMSDLQRFINDYYDHVEGEMMKFSEFYDHFIEIIDPELAKLRQLAVKEMDKKDHPIWTKIKVGRELPPQFPRAPAETNQVFVGNIVRKDAYKPNGHKKPRLGIKNGKLVPL